MALELISEDYALIPTMGKLMKEIRAIITREFQINKIDLTKEQAIVLHKLNLQDGRPQQDLALVTARDKTSLTRLLTTMEKKRLIRRERCTKDRRSNLVHITQKGRKELEKAVPIVLHIFDNAINGIDRENIEKTKRLLNDIYINLNLEYDE